MDAVYYHGNKTFKSGKCIPQAPKPDEVRIDVAFCGVCGTDLHIYQGHMDKRVSIPLVIGHEMSGIIAEVGAGVSGWKEGDRVVVRPLGPCGACPACRAGYSHICHKLKFMGIDTPGAFQKSWTVPAHTLHRLPDSLSLKEAAMIEPISVACHDVRLSEVKPGDYTVVIGGGPIGMLIALVAHQEGARVLVSELNPARVDLARELGLDGVNPDERDLASYVNEQTEGTGADVIFEVSGSAAGASVMTELARTRGRIVIVAIFAEPPQVNLFRFFWRELRLCGARVYEKEDFEKAIGLTEGGNLPLDKLITACLPLSELQSVFEQMESGVEMMKVLINTQGGSV